MKVYSRNFKHNIVKLRTATLDDLWYLSQIITSGDRLKAKTVRRIKDKDDMARATGGERKTITVTIAVEDLDLTDANTLRAQGTIVSGPEDLVPLGSHHTLTIDTDTELSIAKDVWTSLEKQRLSEAEKAGSRPKLVIAVIDDGQATLAIVREAGVSYVDVDRAIGGKDYDQGRQKRVDEFHRETAQALEAVLAKEEAPGIIVAGCGFWKNAFHDYLRERHPDIAEKSVVENIGSYGRNGVAEVLKRPVAKRFAEDLAAARDATLIEELLARIGKDNGLATYGEADVRKAASYGAIETLLASTTYFMAHRDALDELAGLVRNQQGGIHLVNAHDEPGEQLDGLGGIAALLRFRVE